MIDVYDHLKILCASLRTGPGRRRHDRGVTSDSLAAAFSNMYAAEELVVMKSCDAPRDESDLESLADVGFVDPYFMDLAEGIDQVRFVNLQKYK